MEQTVFLLPYLIKHKNKIGLLERILLHCALCRNRNKILINARFTARQFNMYLKDMSYTKVQYSEKQVFFLF